MSGPEVIGLIGGIFTILRETKEIYEAATDASGLTKKLRHTAEELEFVEYVLDTAKEHLESTTVSEDEVAKARPLLEICRDKLDLIKQIFAKHLPALSAGRAERFLKAARAQLKKKGDEVKEAMGVVLRQLELLAQNEILKSADMLTDIKNAIEEMDKATDDEEGHQFNNYGNGPFNPNIGGKQENYNHSGEGHMYNGINHIHHTIAKTQIDSRDKKYEKALKLICSKSPSVSKRCLRLLQIMMLVQRPLDVDELGSVSDTFDHILEVEQALEWCAPFMREDDSRVSLHKSAHKYLETADPQSQLARFGTYTHGDMGRRCLEYLQRHLLCNFPELDSLDASRYKLSGEQRDGLSHLRYASANWAKHVELSVRESSSRHGPFNFDRFFQRNFLEWVECLLWCEDQGLDIAKGVLETLAKVAKLSLSNTQLTTELEYLDILQRFLGYFSGFFVKPLQLYPFALFFYPAEGPLHEQSLEKIHRWAKAFPGLQEHRPSLNHVLNDFPDHEQDAAVAFSPDGSLLTVAWRSRNQLPVVGLWCIGTKQLRTWKLNLPSNIRTETLERICCSPDNRQMACVFWGGCILVVDADTGRLEKILNTERKHAEFIRALAFSNDGSMLAAGDERTIRLWDIKTGHLHATLGHSAWTYAPVASLAFSSDDQKLVSGHRYGSVRVWDLSRSGDERVVRLQTLPDDYGVPGASVEAKVAFSSDGTQILANGYEFEALGPEADSSGSQIPEVFTHDGDTWLYYQQKPLFEHAKYQNLGGTWDMFKDYLVLSRGPEVFVVSFGTRHSE